MQAVIEGMVGVLVASLTVSLSAFAVVPARTTPTSSTTSPTVVGDGQSCAQTLLPIYSEKHAYNGPGVEPGAQHLEYPSQFDARVDSDGNPISFGIAPDGTSNVQIARQDGVVTLTGPNGLGMAVGTWSFGDLNGDGRGDYVVQEFNSDPRTNATYVVSGMVSPGVHDVRKIGTRIPANATPRGQLNFAQFIHPIGDQNDNGTDDAAVGNRLYDGRSLLARRPGTTLTVLPKPFGRVDHLNTALRLAADGPPVLVQVLGYIDQSSSATDHLELRLLGPHVTCLSTTDGAIQNLPCDQAQQGRYPCEDYPITSDLEVVAWQQADGHRIVQASQATRAGTTTYRWDLGSG